MPLIEELRLAGATDFLMYPLPFRDQTGTAVTSFAAQRPKDSEQASLDALELAPKLLSLYLGRHVLRRIAIDLLDTDVGPRRGH